MEFSEFWKLRNEELAIAEQQEREEERQRRVEMTNYLKKQVDCNSTVNSSNHLIQIQASVLAF